jgi:acetylornithine/succinyldiaminopimelate/putrescine aminotransferase
MTKLQSGHAASMLQQLIAEAENKAVVFSDDLSTQTREQLLQGLAACHEDDVLFENWHSKNPI